MKYGIFSGLFVLILWAILTLLQLWLGILAADVFFKITITTGILLAIIIVVTLVLREYFSEKQLKKDGFID